MKIYLAVAAGLLVAVVVLVGVLLLRPTTGSTRPVPSKGGDALQTVSFGEYPYYLQGDPDWANLPIGGSSESMAAVGCTITCIAMGLSGLGNPMTPAEVCENLKANGGFTDNGYVIWGRVGSITNGAVEMAAVDLSHDRIDRELVAGRPVVAKVMLGGTVQHWVLVVTKDGEEYLAMDPLNESRQVVPISSLSDKIYAIRVFRTR